jgi:Ca2+-binding EF-hand superfamily protein
VSNFFMKHFDIDGDGLINFHEYLLIVTLLSIPLKDAEIAFAMLDADDSDTIDKEEFEALTAVLKQRSRKTAGAGAGRTGLHVDTSEDDTGLMLHFFGENGQKKLDLAAFNAFLEGLHAEIDRLEFQHYDPQGTGYMTGRDFAHSMIASVGLHQIHHYLSVVDSMPDSLKTAKVSQDGFQTFATLWRNVHSLAVATDLHYNSMGFFRKADFKRAAKKITGRSLEDAQVDIIFSLFDVENDGSLACSEFVGVIKQREGRHGTTTPAVIDEMREMGLVTCLRNCVGL